LIPFVLLVIGSLALVRAAALVSSPLGWAMFGLACVTLSLWPALRSWIVRE
jgi:hypothetical protein